MRSATGAGASVGLGGRGVLVGVEGTDVGVAVAGRGVGLGAAVEMGSDVGVFGRGVGPGEDMVVGMSVDARVEDGGAVDCDVSVGVPLAVHAVIESTVKSVGNNSGRYLSILPLNRYPPSFMLLSVSQRCPDRA